MKDRVERVVGAIVFAPIGFALSARDLVPTLARQGRERVTAQLAAARMIGEVVVREGRREAGRRAGRLADDLFERLTGGQADEPAADRPPARHTAPAGAKPARSIAGSAAAGNGRARPGVGEAASAAAALAIPGYDSLSAFQVVPRLEGLTADELESVRRYEAAGRRRKTILGKIDQLQSGS